MPGIDYSKWDRMEFSDDDDEQQDGMASTEPRVTRLDQPSQVTVTSNGEVAIAPRASSSANQNEAFKGAAGSDIKPYSSGKGPSASATTVADAMVPISWTSKGGCTRVQNTETIWTQDRESVTLRCLIPPDRPTRNWTVRVTRMLKYVDRNVGVTTTDAKPILEIRQGDWMLLSPTALPHPVHRAQDDDDDEHDAIDWTIDRTNDKAYLTIHLLKAAPMDGVVIWWNRPMEGADEISMEWRSNMATSNFQQAWDEAHRQFREKMAPKNA